MNLIYTATNRFWYCFYNPLDGPVLQILSSVVVLYDLPPPIDQYTSYPNNWGSVKIKIVNSIYPVR